MIGALRPTKPVDKFVVISRKGERDGVIHTSGAIVCDTCRGFAMSQHDLAREIGVSPAHLSAFLNRRPLRADVADKIRHSVLRVEE